MEIRRERPEDHAAVRAVHRAAFGGREQVGDVVEAVLVDRLRDGPWWLPRLSLVAVVGGTVVGHVIATRATVQPSGAPVLGLGPLGVEPAQQRQGIGTALMHAVLGAAEALDESMVGLLGDPAYYGRFGFVAAAASGVDAPDPRWGAAFQIRVLSGPQIRGEFRYAESFERLG
jgi:putative acetyltransferase